MNSFQFPGESSPNIEYLLEKSSELRNVTPLESLRLNEEALHYAELTNDKDIWYKCLLGISRSHLRLGNHHQAYHFLTQAGKYKVSPEYQWLIGNVYRIFGDLAQGLYHQFECLNGLGINPDPELEFDSLSEIALIYHKQSEYELELSIYQQILELKLKTSNTHVAGLYNNMAMAELGLRRFKEAFYHARLAYKLGLETNQKTLACTALCSLGEILMEAKQAQKALKYLKLSLKQARDLGVKSFEIFSLRFIGMAYFALGQPQEGLTHLDLALSLARKTNDTLELSYCHEQLASAYKTIGDYQKALAHFERYHQLYKDLLNTETLRNLQELRVLHEIKTQ